MAKIEELYKTSTDYKKLFERIHAGDEIVCLVDYLFYMDKELCWTDRDICRARKSDHGEISFLVRGCCYITLFSREAQNKELFITLCEKYHVVWVVSDENKISECIHCGAILRNDSSDNSHWESCESHPARIRLVEAKNHIRDLTKMLKKVHHFVSVESDMDSLSNLPIEDLIKNVIHYGE